MTQDTPSTTPVETAPDGAGTTIATEPIRQAPLAGATRTALVSPPALPRRGWRPTRKQLLLIGSGVLAIVLVAGIVAYLTSAAQIGSLLTARDFCTAIQQQDYPKAYTFFAPQLQQQIPRDAFITISLKGDELQGKVMDCSATGVDVALGGQAVTVHSVVTRSIIGKQHNDLHLVLENGAWKIDEPPDPLLLPLTTAYLFCEDVKAQKYADAYGSLSPALQQQVSQDAFTTISQGSDDLYGKVTACNVSGVEASGDHTAVVVHSTLVREKVTKPSDLHLGLFDKHWKISTSPDPLLLPLAAAFDFCNDLKTQNYTAAYAFFSSDLQQQVPQNAFVAISQGSDGLNGKVTACTVTGVDASADGTAVVVHSSVVRTKGSQPGDLHLVLQGGRWKIGQSPDPLLIPLVTAFNFCEALKAQNYGLAYSYFATPVQQQIPRDAFVSISQGGDTLQGKVSACNVSGVQMSTDGASVVVESTLVRARQTQSSTLHLALIGGQWKIGQSPDPLLVPLTAAYTFCQDLKAQSYVAAYAILSSGLQAQVSRDAFVTILQGADTLQGKVTACTVTGVQMSADGASVLVQSTVVRTIIGGQPSDLHLTLGGGRWTISQSPDPLLLPLTTAYYFCQDLKAQDYSSAYKLMSASAQAKLGSPLALQLAIGASQIVTGKLTGCQVTSVAFSSDRRALTVHSTLSFDRSQPLPSTVNEVIDSNGAWRVDRLTIVLLGIPISIPAT